MPRRTPRLGFNDDEKAKIDEYLARKVDLENKRRDLLQELEQVDSRITEMQADYGAIYNKRNPILRLPVEVTCLIFTLARLPRIAVTVEDDSSDDSSDDDDEMEEEEAEVDGLMEVVVSQVCRQWRAISLGFPRLWNTFYFEADASRPLPLERFDAYMERSVTLPLRIWFDFKPGTNGFNNALLVERAIRHAHRWQHFTLYSGDEAVMKTLRRLRDLSAPMLLSLTLAPGIELTDDESEEAVEESLREVASLDPVIFKGGTPKLTYSMLDGYSIRHALPPLSNLTILRIEKHLSDDIPVFEPGSLLELLSLPSLTQLSLVGDIIQPLTTPPNCIQMPSMKRLRVGEFDAIWDLLPSIRAPQLDTLIIHMCHSPYGLAEEESFGHYSLPELRKLYVIDSNLELTVIHSFIQATRQATDVLISHDDISTSALQRIVDERCADVVWPRLKTLSCITSGQRINTLLMFAGCRPRHSFTFRIPALMLEGWEEGMQALGAVSMVDLRVGGWELNEPFWPPNVGPTSRFDFGRDDSFSLGDHL